MEFEYAEQNMIMNYEVIACHFMKKILDMNYANAIISDESWLSDFVGSNLTDEQYHKIADEYDTKEKTELNYRQSEALYNELKRKCWDKIVRNQIIAEYNIDIKETSIVLYVLFEEIKKYHDIGEFEKEIKLFTYNRDDEDLDWDQLKKELESKPQPVLTQKEIESHLEHTTNPFFYAKHMNMTFSEAIELMEKRMENKAGHYKAYRP